MTNRIKAGNRVHANSSLWWAVRVLLIWVLYIISTMVILTNEIIAVNTSKVKS